MLPPNIRKRIDRINELIGGGWLPIDGNPDGLARAIEDTKKMVGQNLKLWTQLSEELAELDALQRAAQAREARRHWLGEEER